MKTNFCFRGPEISISAPTRLGPRWLVFGYQQNDIFWSQLLWDDIFENLTICILDIQTRATWERRNFDETDTKQLDISRDVVEEQNTVLGRTGESSVTIRLWNECQSCIKAVYNHKYKPPSRLYGVISVSLVFRRKSSSYLGSSTGYPDWWLLKVCLSVFRTVVKSYVERSSSKVS